MDQKTYTRCLNLAASALEPLPIGGTITSGIRRGETWLLCSSEADGVYTVIEGDSAKCFTWADSAFQLLSSPQHLLMTDPSGRNLTLYDTNGSFLSQCALPQNSNAVLGTDFVWSSCLEGYFFTDFMDSSCRLMFWDISAETEGASLQMSAPEQPQPPQRVLDRSLYERAEELSRRFIVLNFLIAFVAFPLIFMVSVLSEIVSDTSVWQQLLYVMPALTVLGIAASVAVRRCGYGTCSLFIQFTGPILFAVSLVVVPL